jgi:inorganic triphosphatase YgiF
LRLAEHGVVKPSIRTKSARGFDLAADKPPSARRPRKLRLDPSVTLDEAFATILRSCFLHLLQSLPAAEDGRNPEGVHQLRVALRRLRSALDLMRSVGALSNLDALRSEARWLAQDLSAARDWDAEALRTTTLREQTATLSRAASAAIHCSERDPAADDARKALREMLGTGSTAQPAGSWSICPCPLDDLACGLAALRNHGHCREN